MADLFLFQPKRKLRPADNVRAFVRACREQHTAFGAKLPFDDDVWDVTDTLRRRASKSATRLTFCTRRSVKNTQPVPLAEPFKSFAKAFLRYLHGTRPSKMIHHRLAALRALEEALLSQRRTADVHKITPDTLNNAAQLLKAQFVEGVTYRTGCALELVASFLDEHSLTDTPLQWRNPFKRPKDYKTRVGKEFEARRQAKLPSAAALAALASAFNRAERPNDILVASTAALLCSNPSRISEVLTLPAECEAFPPPGSKKSDAFGLRWWPSKGADPQIKWVLPSMAPIVRRALENIRSITEPARRVAAWYERHPDRLYLPPALAHLRRSEFLTYAEVTEILGGGDGKVFCSRYKLPRKRVARCAVVSFRDVERAVLSLLPSDFPVFDHRSQLSYSRALFVVLNNQFRDYAVGPFPCMIQRVDEANIARGLGTRVRYDGTSMFTRLDLTEEDGTPIVITSHQFRHYLDTLASQGGMSQLDIAKWSGRADIKHNRAYDHESAAELLDRLRNAVGEDALWRGPLPELAKATPASRSEFATLIAPTAHVTALGFCIHDFTMTPCQLHRDCLWCTSLVCVKGNSKKTSAIRDRLADAKRLQRLALEASEAKEYGADRWARHNTEAIQRLEMLVSVLEDPNVPDGTLVQLASSSVPSRIRGAAERRGDLDLRSGPASSNLPSQGNLKSLPARSS